MKTSPKSISRWGYPGTNKLNSHQERKRKGLRASTWPGNSLKHMWYPRRATLKHRYLRVLSGRGFPASATREQKLQKSFERNQRTGRHRGGGGGLCRVEITIGGEMGPCRGKEIHNVNFGPKSS